MSNLSPSKVSELLGFAHQLADASGQAILPFFRTGASIENKQPEDFDPVTEGDRAGEQAIRSLIKEHFPDHGIVGEEFGAENEGAEFCWVVDPIDGTRGFIAGTPLWGTLIACLHDGQPIIGLLDQPYLRERFVGVTALGYRDTSFSAQGTTRGLSTRPCRSVKDAILTTTTPVLFAEGVERKVYEAVESASKLVRYSLDCYGYGLLALGCLDIVVEAGLAPYDILALIPIVEAAGGQVTDWSGNQPLQGGQILATGDKAVHDQALKVLSTAAI